MLKNIIAASPDWMQSKLRDSRYIFQQPTANLHATNSHFQLHTDNQHFSLQIPADWGTAIDFLWLMYTELLEITG